jgi:hypothetical protein
MSKDFEHEETYTHKNGKTYNVRWYADYDMGSPLEWEDCHGVTERMDWNPTNEEQLEQHIIDEEPELEEETRLRMMRVLARPSNRFDSGLYYDFMRSCELARTEWGVAPDKVVEVVEKDYAHIKGWYDDDWHWVSIGVAPIDEDGEIMEDHRDYLGGIESTIMLSRDADDVAYREELIEEKIAEVEYTLRREQHEKQLELSFA